MNYLILPANRSPQLDGDPMVAAIPLDAGEAQEYGEALLRTEDAGRAVSSASLRACVFDCPGMLVLQADGRFWEATAAAQKYGAFGRAILINCAALDSIAAPVNDQAVFVEPDGAVFWEAQLLDAPVRVYTDRLDPGMLTAAILAVHPLRHDVSLDSVGSMFEEPPNPE